MSTTILILQVILLPLGGGRSMKFDERVKRILNDENIDIILGAKMADFKPFIPVLSAKIAEIVCRRPCI